MKKAGHIQAANTTPAFATHVPGRALRQAAGRTGFAGGYSGNQAALRRLSRTTPQLQRKLEIGATNDPLESQADVAADQVMGMSNSASMGGLHRKCASCEQEDVKVNRKENAQSRDAGHAPPIVHQTINSPGEPLDAATREFFEPRFGADFSDVRVHSDPVAQQSASAVNARAYAAGHNIVLGAGASPGVNPLVAHELAHVAQNKDRARRRRDSP
ncbi:MAG TPA: DUF4157 domain-containing protein [Terracidiphilus sp.]|jgi:hypothetical protein